MSTLTPAQLADELQMPEDEVERLRVLRKWPHLKPNRRTVRYTPEQVAFIKGLITVSPPRAMPTNGQTPGSAKRTA